MTLKEIAREAGVSISTVSRVINKNSTNAASKEVQDRIWEIVRRTGYTPNSTARDLKMGGSESPEPLSRSIACLFARTEDSKSDLFFPRWHAVSSRRRLSITMCSNTLLQRLTFITPTPFVSGQPCDGVVVLGR